MKGTITVDKERCKGCGLCVSVCPSGVITLSHEVNSKGYNFLQLIDEKGCVGCATCARMCPDSVITVYRTRQ